MPETIKKIRPTPSDAYLANPHKGCCTFQKFNGDALFPGTYWTEEGPTEFPTASIHIAPGYLPTTVSYCRWFWRTLEPKQGQYDFSVIEKAMEVARQRGQTLAVRLMAFGSRLQPQVPEWYSTQYPLEKWVDFGGRDMVVPVHDSPEYLKYWGALLKEFAKRYDGHPMLETIDMAYLGPWGEGAGKIGPEQCDRFVALFKEAFRQTPRMTLIEEHQLKKGVESGAGWRCDCFGDLSAYGSAEVPIHLSWNHTFDAYPQLLYQAGAMDAWKTGPIHLETCQVPLEWSRRGYDLDLIIQQGLKYHATYFMPKSTRISQEWMKKMADFCQKLGYRYIYRQAQFDITPAPGQPYRLRSWIENVGIAPIYRRYDLALRFRQGEKQSIVALNDIDIRTWLPGDVYIDSTVTLPRELQPGLADLSIGLIDPATREARIRFAVKENYPDRWMPLDQIFVQSI